MKLIENLSKIVGLFTLNKHNEGGHQNYKLTFIKLLSI